MKRRDFLRAGLSGAAAFSMAGLVSSLSAPVRAATINISFIVETVNKTLVDGATVPVWQFRDASGSGGPGLLGSGLVVRAGDTVNVTIQNQLDRAVNFEVPGIVENSPLCLPGDSLAYQFVAPAPGSYFYCDRNNGDLSKAMGLCGPMLVMPADGSNRITNNDPLFDRQYTLVLQELDSRINTLAAAGGSPDLASYEPDYFFVNGLSYPQTTSDATTAVQMMQARRTAFRIINAGLIYNPLHFHGYHVQVEYRNRLREPYVVNKDTVPVHPHETVDVTLIPDKPGTYPMHSHFLPAVTANGVYANGALLLMTAV